MLVYGIYCCVMVACRRIVYIAVAWWTVSVLYILLWHGGLLVYCIYCCVMVDCRRIVYIAVKW